MKQVLYITDSFPPRGGIGSLRVVRHLKHMSEFGWAARVLTIGGIRDSENRDEFLLKDIPNDARVTSTRFLDVGSIPRWLRHIFYFVSYDRPWLSNFPKSTVHALADRLLRQPTFAAAQFTAGLIECFPPDPYVGWLPFAFSKGKKIIANEGIDVVYSVGPPHSSHLIGYLLKKATGKPWVADFRDEWSQNPTRHPLFKWQWRLDRWMEQRVLCAADFIVTSTEPYQHALSSLAPFVSPGKFHTITNSFDADDFSTTHAKPRGARFRVVYCGSFYAMQQPMCFLSAVEELVTQGSMPLDGMELVFAGNAWPSRFEGFEDRALAKSIQRVGFVSHSRVVEYLMSADLLLLILSTARGRDNMPAKLFEYIGTGKPILALVPPDGVAADLIRETGTGVVVAPEDISAIKEAFLELYTRWEKGVLQSSPNWKAVNRYEAREVTRRFCQVLDGALERSLDCKEKARV